MKTVTFTEFRKHASALFSDVEAGEIIQVVRHGKTIAEIVPVDDSRLEPSWKKPVARLSVKGDGLAETILKERELAE